MYGNLCFSDASQLAALVLGATLVLPIALVSGLKSSWPGAAIAQVHFRLGLQKQSRLQPLSKLVLDAGEKSEAAKL